ncbi:MAG TPA: toll/interleukin-1 receptor domain-containing protein [Longimicrobium sp.]|nr:toll/interleukin-1 receptor domain-containing protein [Longimicrobium sp.]
MNKGSVFFSHSSKDSAVLRRLKTAVLAKTGGSVDIFLSSDGQSIRLGHNWVSEIEQALTATSLMFVFISPASAASQWVFFEAGFSYARQVQVIPVAIGGVDLGRMPPPISLLQGFNLTSAEHLNNILTQINEKFGHSHKLSFTQGDFEHIFQPSARSVRIEGYVPWVDAVLIRTRVPFTELVPHIEAACHSRDLDYQSSDWDLITYGARYEKISVSNESPRHGDEWMRVEFAPGEGKTHCDILREAIEATGSENTQLSVSYYLSLSVDCIRQRNQLTARLRGSGIRLGPQNNFAFGDGFFWIQRGRDYEIDDFSEDRVRIDLNTTIDKLVAFDLPGLLSTLFRVGVLAIRSAY